MVELTGDRADYDEETTRYTFLREIEKNQRIKILSVELGEIK
jgi:hypothetical protein